MNGSFSAVSTRADIWDRVLLRQSRGLAGGDVPTEAEHVLRDVRSRPGVARRASDRFHCVFFFPASSRRDASLLATGLGWKQILASGEGGIEIGP